MNNILKTLRSIIVLGFIFYIVFLFAKFLLIPIFIFILIMKLLRMLNVKLKYKNKPTKKTDDIIDVDFEELD